jgi:hypothetical protein
MSSDRTNAERQARHRAKQRKEQAALEAELRALRNSGGQAKAGADATLAQELARAKARIAELEKRFQPGERVEDIARALFATFASDPDKGRKIANRWLGLLAVHALKSVPAKAPEWWTPAQVKRMSLPKSMEHYFVMANWLRGHEQRVIEVMIAPQFTGDPLDPAEQILAELPGVYRIARIVGGSFGPKRNQDKRPQVRALMAVTERALQEQPLGRGGWSSPGNVVIYDPRKPVT